VNFPRIFPEFSQKFLYKSHLQLDLQRAKIDLRTGKLETLLAISIGLLVITILIAAFVTRKALLIRRRFARINGDDGGKNEKN
jgi:heme A synthase